MQKLHNLDSQSLSDLIQRVTEQMQKLHKCKAHRTGSPFRRKEGTREFM